MKQKSSIRLKQKELFIHGLKSYSMMLLDLSQLNEKKGVTSKNASAPFLKVNL